MADRKNREIFADHSGGRNAIDPPWEIAKDQCVDAVNIEYYNAPFGAKRKGLDSSNISFTGPPTPKKVSFLFRRAVTAKEGTMELWAIDSAATPNIWLSSSAAFTVTITPTDALTGNGWDCTAAVANDRAAITYKSAVDRLHGSLGGSVTLTRNGLAAPVAPTAADTGAGTYANVLRYYRTRWTTQSGGVTIRRSEAGASVSFTPSGGGTAARVTKPANAGETETHWELEASTDNVTFYRIATTVIATTTYDDSAATTSYNTNPLSALTGIYTLQKSYRFVASDQNRLLGFSSWTTTDKQDRIELSAVVGSLDVGDVERVDTTINYFLDLDESDSGEPTGLAGPVLGTFFAFKFRKVYQLTPTGQTTQPYRADALTSGDGSIGAIAQGAITIGEDQDGNPAIYWMSHVGPYRWTHRGMEYIGKRIEDLILGPTSTLNMTASNTGVVARALYYPQKRQVWFWWATGSSTDPDAGAIYHVKTGGWSRFKSGDLITKVRCCCLFSDNPAGTTKRMKPYLGLYDADAHLVMADTGGLDDGTAFQAYVTTRAFEPGGPGFYGEVGNALLVAAAQTGATISNTLILDFGATSSPTAATASLTPSANAEPRVIKPFLESAYGKSGSIQFYQCQVGDAAAATTGWTLERLIVPIASGGAVTQ